MPILAGDVLRRASVALNDEDFVRWTRLELFDWLNDTAAEIVLRRPAARAVTAVLPLVAGTLQALPTGSLLLIDIIRNIKADDSPGRPVRRIDRQLLDDQLPTWHELKQADTLKHFTYDEASPTTFYVYPPAKAGVKAEILRSEAPPLVAADDDLVLLDAAYMSPLVAGLLYRAYSKDSEYANAGMSISWFQAFSEALGVQNSVTNEASPNVRTV
jgi:hypothetical protein